MEKATMDIVNTDQPPVGDAAGTSSVAALAEAVCARTASAVQLTSSTRSAIDESEPSVRAWVRLSETCADDAAAVDAAVVATAAADRLGRFPLAGVSIGVKDLIDVAGLPTRAGSPVTAAEPVPADAPVVARLRELGAVVQGKTVTTEFGYFAPGPTRNPHAPDHTPGGSSSGSAAAVGAGVVPVALGTQTAGSLTRPASFCGAAGLVLAHGTVDLGGVTGLSESLDSLGLLTATVADLRYVFGAFTGRPNVRAGLAARAFVWSGSGLGPVEPSMMALIDELPALLAEIGIATARLDRDDHIRTLTDDHVIVMSYEAARSRGTMLERHGSALSRPLRDLLVTGGSITDDDYRAALARRDRSRILVSEALPHDAVVIGPAALGPAPAGIDATGSPVLSRPWQLLGLPAVTIPGARTGTGLPLGLQVVGVPGAENVLFDVAEALEPRLRALAPITV